MIRVQVCLVTMSRGEKGRVVRGGLMVAVGTTHRLCRTTVTTACQSVSTYIATCLSGE